MTDEPRWRAATADDAPALAALVHAAYRGPGGWTNEIGLVEGRRVDAVDLGHSIERDEAIVVVVDGDDGPVAVCRVGGGEDGVAHLGLFAVRPDRQGAGLGRGLVSLARRLAAERLGADTLEIAVVSGQAALLGWYERLGFRVTGRTRPFGDDPRDRPLVPGLHFVVLRTPLLDGVDGGYLLSWSGGKDSALALQALRGAGAGLPDALVTTVTAGYDRVSMHGVRRTLLHAQARSLGVPLVEAVIPPGASNEVYERAFAGALGSRSPAAGSGTGAATGPGASAGAGAGPAAARVIAFGDLFLADIRAYREARCAAAGLGARFPLWHDDTAALARRFVADGFRAHLVCVDPTRLAASFAGREFDASLLADLPAAVDPCGENGEFHTFVSDGPGFRSPLPVTVGEVVHRDGFAFADLLPG